MHFFERDAPSGAIPAPLPDWSPIERDGHLLRSLGPNLEFDLARVEVRRDAQRFDGTHRQWLEPHGLPDPPCGRVEDRPGSFLPLLPAALARPFRSTGLVLTP